MSAPPAAQLDFGFTLGQSTKPARPPPAPETPATPSPPPEQPTPGPEVVKERCRSCGTERSERVALHYSKKRCVVACGVLLARKTLGTMCHGCGTDELEATYFERPELPGHPFCWPCAENGAAFWDWHHRMWTLEAPATKYPFDMKYEQEGRHKAWPFTRLGRTTAASSGTTEG